MHELLFGGFPKQLRPPPHYHLRLEGEGGAAGVVGGLARTVRCLPLLERKGNVCVCVCVRVLCLLVLLFVFVFVFSGMISFSCVSRGNARSCGNSGRRLQELRRRGAMLCPT